MNHNNYPQGSTWIRCDLHVHTPKSIEQHFKYGDSNDGWENYISDLEKLPPEFKVIAINDYLFIDGYKKVLSYKTEKKRLRNLDLILPAVEMRFARFGGAQELSKINFHVIFANEDILSNEVIQQQFINSLTAKVQLSSEKGNLWNGAINETSLEEFGKAIKSTMPPDKVPNISNKKMGFMNLTFNESKIFELLEGHHFNRKNKPLFLTAIGKNEWDDVRWDSAIADKKDMINRVDFVFCASQTVEQYGKSKKKLEDERVNSKLIHGSDAHYLSFDTKAPPNMKLGHCFTWIKANPTFEGIRQLTYEFDSRLFTSATPPPSKKPYHVINRVRFIDNTGADKFQSTDIYLNPNLNVIIGGKSTGKSLMLNHIAKTIDHEEFKNRAPLVSGYQHEKHPDFDFIVIWQDGVEDYLKSGNNSRKIVYIPQGYVDELTSNDFKNKLVLNKFIQNIILQNQEAQTFYDGLVEEIETLKNNTANEIINLFNQRDRLQSTREEAKEVGDKKGVVSYISKLTFEINELKSEGLTEQEATKYEELIKEEKKLTENFLNLQEDQERIESYNANLQSFMAETKNSSPIANTLSTPRLRIRFLEEYGFLNSVSEKISGAHNELLEFVKTLTNENEKELLKLGEKFKPLSTKIKRAEELKSKREEIKREGEKLRAINALLDKVREQESKIQNIKEQIKINYKNLFNKYTKIATEFKGFTSITSDLSISIRVGFDEKLFNERLIQNNVNKPSIKIFLPQHCNQFGEFQFSFDKTQHVEDIEKLFEGILNQQILLNQGGSIRQTSDSLLDDFFFLDYSIAYQSDDLKDMSPGKKNIVMLKILIELSNAESPILIDQPEDDLDNRSIYIDLVKFLKDKKNKRQIIIVTHNPNIVVGADAEEILVANQEGQVKSRDNRRYKFEYVSGALENSFTNTGGLGVLFKMGIREHACDILEGGAKAFQEREKRYSFLDIE